MVIYLSDFNICNVITDTKQNHLDAYDNQIVLYLTVLPCLCPF